ncbi:hypothetical protein [Amaricoccus sp.]|uniref:hypothetical protein n=1 Tax=Amaricoccus sp. TaxID=1872485 RepID=UPI001B5D8CB1|nr:hypothetical protein [Amaricoccus sp.]MBP7241624.1 hypothetical protein [Amaricoccus sp.]
MSLSLASPLAAAALLLPSLAFAGLTLMRDAPAEWGRAALIAWTALVAAGLGGAAGGGPLAAALLLGFAAIMIGGPPGLAVAALAAAAPLVLGTPPTPRWTLAALAALPALAALRQALA